SLAEVHKHFSWLPTALQVEKTQNIKGLANIGIIGGNNVGFFQEYCQSAKAMISKNEAVLPLINKGTFNQILDEFFFYCLAAEKGLEIDYLINTSPEVSIKHVLRFNLVPLMDKYIHLVGIAKQSKYSCEQLELRFKYEFPEEYRFISRVISDKMPGVWDMESLETERLQRIYRTLPVLYECTVDQIVEKRIVLNEKYTIKENIGEQEEAATYSLHVETPEGVITSELREQDQLMAYFISPVSINDLLEELSSYNQDKQYLETQKIKLVDFALEKILIDGTLEFI
ncbi:MAG TPA: DUF6734 family protein, partial [Puia sp.]